MLALLPRSVKAGWSVVVALRERADHDKAAVKKNHVIAAKAMTPDPFSFPFSFLQTWLVWGR
jgi:hypothetical protein